MIQNVHRRRRNMWAFWPAINSFNPPFYFECCRPWCSPARDSYPVLLEVGSHRGLLLWFEHWSGIEKIWHESFDSFLTILVDFGVARPVASVKCLCLNLLYTTQWIIANECWIEIWEILTWMYGRSWYVSCRNWNYHDLRRIGIALDCKIDVPQKVSIWL